MTIGDRLPSTSFSLQAYISLTIDKLFYFATFAEINLVTDILVYIRICLFTHYIFSSPTIISKSNNYISYNKSLSVIVQVRSSIQDLSD